MDEDSKNTDIDDSVHTKACLVMDEDSKNTKIIKTTGELWGEFYASKCFSAFFF